MSTILPLPSSPHCAPSTAMLVFAIQVYRNPQMVALDGSSLTLDDLAAIAFEQATVSLTQDARARVDAARTVVDAFARGDQPAYGINTGFGNFADVRIPGESLAELQVNLLRSHAAGGGEAPPGAGVPRPLAPRAH